MDSTIPAWSRTMVKIVPAVFQHRSWRQERLQSDVFYTIQAAIPVDRLVSSALALSIVAESIRDLS